MKRALPIHTFRLRLWTGVLVLGVVLAATFVFVVRRSVPPSSASGPALIPPVVRRPSSMDVAGAGSTSAPPLFPNPVNVTSRPDTVHRPVAQALESRYRELLENSGNPAYSNLLAVLVVHAPDRALSTDLFNDACAYAVSMTMVRQWRAEDAGQQRVMNRELAGAEALADRTAIEEAAVERSLDARYGPLEGFFRSFYAHRFHQRHGLDGEGLAEELALVELPNAGREFTFRCP